MGPALPLPNQAPKIHRDKNKDKTGLLPFSSLRVTNSSIFSSSAGAFGDLDLPESRGVQNLQLLVATGYLLFLSGDSGGNCSLGQRTRLVSFALDQRQSSVGVVEATPEREGCRQLTSSRSFLFYQPVIPSITHSPR